MFSKVISRVSQYQQLTSLQTRAFRASAIANANQKPSIGDAVTILQSKVSGINQVVSTPSLKQTIITNARHERLRLQHKNAPWNSKNKLSLNTAYLFYDDANQIFFLCLERP